MWEQLRQSAQKLIEESGRLGKDKERLSNLPKMWKLKDSLKKEIRDDIFRGLQTSNREREFAYAKEHLQELERYADKELEWLEEWGRTFTTSIVDCLELDEETKDGFPKLSLFKEISDIDWLLYTVIKGDTPKDLPNDCSFTGVLAQLVKVRREQKADKKVSYIQNYVKSHKEEVEAYATDQCNILTDLDPTLASMSEIKAYWINHYLGPKKTRQYSTQALKEFEEKNGRPPTSYEEVTDLLPKEALEMESVKTEINRRLLMKIFNKTLQEQKEAAKNETIEPEDTYKYAQ